MDIHSTHLRFNSYNYSSNQYALIPVSPFDGAHPLSATQNRFIERPDPSPFVLHTELSTNNLKPNQLCSIPNRTTGLIRNYLQF
jgi:hypothetical protein